MENQRGFRNKRKGRKSGRESKFLRVAGKKGRDGDRGKGFKIDEDTYNYFLNVLKVKRKNEFESEEDREAFIRNSLDQTEGHEVDYSRNQMLSRVLENLLEQADSETLTRFCTAFTPQLRVICADSFASHVLETLLQTIQNNWILTESLREWFHSTCRFVLNNFEDFVFDPYANKVMRKVFCCLSGTVVSSQHLGSAKLEPKVPICVAKDEQAENVELHKCYNNFKSCNEELLKDFSVRFVNWHQFNDLLGDANTSGLVQSLTQAMHFVDKSVASELVVAALKTVGADFSWDEGTSLHLVENAIEVSDRTIFEFIFHKYFENKISDMVTHRKANHTLKKLLVACPAKNVFETLYDAVKDKFSEILQANHTNLIVALAEGCKRFGTRQAELMKGVETLLAGDTGSGANTTLVELLLSDQSKQCNDEDNSDRETPVGSVSAAYNRSKILQCFFHFHKPSKVVSGLLNLGRSRIVKLCSDTAGSRVIDEFFRSPTVGDKNKEQMLNMLQEDFVDLACSKLGSRVMDSIWAWASIPQKTKMVAVLSSRIPKLNSDRFGKFFSEKAAVSLYKKSAKEWEEHVRKTLKRPAVTPSLSEEGCKEEEDDNPAVKKKKKKKNKEELQD